MSADVVFAQPSESVAILMGRMTDRRIRHLPVLRESRLAGVISIGDVVKCQIAEATNEVMLTSSEWRSWRARAAGIERKARAGLMNA